MRYGSTAHNKRYTLRRLFGGSGFGFARSVAPYGRSFPRETSPTFGRARLARPNVVYLERYAKCRLGFMKNNV